MDRLPLEIILARPRIASLSRKWQFAVEPLIFRCTRVLSTELDEFASVFSAAQSRRRSLLKELRLDVVLPTYSDADCAVYESNQDRLANDRVASEAVASLFNILSGWGSDPALAITLGIMMHSPMDPWEQSDYDPSDRRPGDLFADRYKYSYTRLLNPDKLPVVPCLKSFYAVAGCRDFHPSSFMDLTAAASAVRNVDWNYIEPSVFLALRREMRDDFVQSLKTFRLAPSTRDFAVEIKTHITRPGIYRHSQRLPNLVFPHQHDPLCSALHQSIGNTLEGLWYTGQVDPSLFWPYVEGEGPREPFWSSLTILSVRFEAGSPSGRWYFRAAPGDDEANVPASDEPLPPDTVGHMPPGYGSAEDTEEALAYGRSMGVMDPEDYGEVDMRDDFRVIPDDEVMLPLLVAFARAIAQIPALKSADLTTRLRDPYVLWFVKYEAPGSSSRHDKYMEEPDGATSQPRVFFHVHD